MSALSRFFDGIHGVILPFAGSAPPNEFLLCDGAAVSRTTYATLFGLIGTTYGVGDGSTTFNVPDLRGRTIIGVGQGAGLTNRTLGAAVGEENHQITEAEMPSHTHTVSDTETSSNNAGSEPGTTQGNTTAGYTTDPTGGDQPHNNMQPSLALNYIIKT